MLNRDEFIYNTIKEVIKLIDDIDKMIDTQASELQKVDSEISDWLHYIENNDTTTKESEKIIKKLKELRIKRKSLHKEYTIEKAYKNHSNKMMGNNTRQLLLSEINKAIKQWENEYKNRILTDEEIKKVLETKKVGRPKKVDKLLESKGE